jgi:hypothetical protein
MGGGGERRQAGAQQIIFIKENDKYCFWNYFKTDTCNIK